MLPGTGSTANFQARVWHRTCIDACRSLSRLHNPADRGVQSTQISDFYRLLQRSAHQTVPKNTREVVHSSFALQILRVVATVPMKKFKGVSRSKFAK